MERPYPHLNSSKSFRIHKIWGLRGDFVGFIRKHCTYHILHMYFAQVLSE